MPSIAEIIISIIGEMLSFKEKMLVIIIKVAAQTIITIGIGFLCIF